MRRRRLRASAVHVAVGLALGAPRGWLRAHLPHGWALWIGRRLGDLFWALLPGRRALALENLERAFGSERAAPERHRLGRRSFEHLGMNLVEACTFLFRPPAVLLSRIEMDGVEHLERAAARGKGVLVLTAHYGNWELLAASHPLTGIPLSIVVRPLDDPLLDRVVGRLRARSGAEVISKRRALRDILEALGRERMIGVLLDQNASRPEGVFVPFFGVPASTSKALAVIALRTGAPVVPIFIRREAGGRHRVQIEPALEPPPDGDVATYTAAFNRAVEGAIRRAPEQWFWLHARWRTRPRDEAA